MPTIETTAELLRLLDENEEFLNAVRNKILTKELLELPQRFAEYAGETDRKIDALNESVAALIEHAAEMDKKIAALIEHAAETDRKIAALTVTVEGLVKHAAETNKRLDGIDERLDGMNDKLNGLRGDALENKMPASLLPRFRAELKLIRPRPVWLVQRRGVSPGVELEYQTKLEDAYDEDIITEEEETRLLVTDMVVRTRREEDNSVVYVAVEASGMINTRDITRARNSAAILRRLYDADAIPAVYGYGIAPEQTEEAGANAEAGQERVHIFLETES